MKYLEEEEKATSIIFEEKKPLFWFQNSKQGKLIIQSMRNEFEDCSFFSEKLLFDLLGAKLFSSPFWIAHYVSAIFTIAKKYKLQIIDGKKNTLKMSVVFMDEVVKHCLTYSDYCKNCKELDDDFSQSCFYLLQCNKVFSNPALDKVPEEISSCSTLDEARHYAKTLKIETLAKRSL